jgi:hypothetical protein
LRTVRTHLPIRRALLAALRVGRVGIEGHDSPHRLPIRLGLHTPLVREAVHKGKAPPTDPVRSTAGVASGLPDRERPWARQPPVMDLDESTAAIRGQLDRETDRSPGVHDRVRHELTCDESDRALRAALRTEESLDRRPRSASARLFRRQGKVAGLTNCAPTCHNCRLIADATRRAFVRRHRHKAHKLAALSVSQDRRAPLFRLFPATPSNETASEI